MCCYVCCQVMTAVCLQRVVKPLPVVTSHGPDDSGVALRFRWASALMTHDSHTHTHTHTHKHTHTNTPQHTHTHTHTQPVCHNPRVSASQFLFNVMDRHEGKKSRA